MENYLSIWLSSVHCITPSLVVCIRLSGGHALYTEMRSAEMYACVSM